MNAWLTGRRPPWAVIAAGGDPWPAAETAELRARGGAATLGGEDWPVPRVLPRTRPEV